MVDSSMLAAVSRREVSVHSLRAKDCVSGHFMTDTSARTSTCRCSTVVYNVLDFNERNKNELFGLLTQLHPSLEVCSSAAHHRIPVESLSLLHTWTLPTVVMGKSKRYLFDSILNVIILPGCF